MADAQKLGQIKQAGRPTKIHSTMDKDILKVHHTKEIMHETVSKPVTHQNVSSDAAAPPGGDVLSKLQGMINQASALVSGGVGLPGIQGIGAQIASMGSAITGGGGTAGIASLITGLGASMASSPMAGMSGLLSSLSGQMSALTDMLNPGGAMSDVIHSHILDPAKGILHSAFSGQHTVTLGQDGIALTSSAKLSSTAPQIPHNGTVLNSDNVFTTGLSLAAAFPLISDARLKDNIEDHPRVLEKIMALRLKTFSVKKVDWENGTEHPDPARESIGLLAQDVQSLFPLLVHGDKILAIEESKIGLLLLAAFQEFVVEVRADIKKLKDNNDA